MLKTSLKISVSRESSSHFRVVIQGWQPVLQPRRKHCIWLVLLCLQSTGLHDALVTSKSTTHAALSVEVQSRHVSPQLVHFVLYVCEDVVGFPFGG